MGSCFSKPEKVVLGEQVEGSIYINVRLPVSERMIGVWCLPATTMKEIDTLIVQRFPHPGRPFGEPVKPKLMMHRFGFISSIDWDVTIQEAGVKNYRYFSYTEIVARPMGRMAASHGFAGGFFPAEFTTEPQFTKAYISKKKRSYGEGLEENWKIYERF